MPISDARLDANRANAQHSTGPCTDEGKAISSMNAVKTGLTGRTVLLTADDAVIYQQHLDRNLEVLTTPLQTKYTRTPSTVVFFLIRVYPRSSVAIHSSLYSK